MPRHARIKSSTNTYHVVVKGADNQLLFEDPKDYQKYMALLEYYKERCEFELLAYCLMSNHVHLLLRHAADRSLEGIFRHLNTAYSTWFNMKYKRTGYVQDGRYYSEPVDEKCLDIEQLRKRTPDDVAKDIIFDTCKCNSVADFQKLSLSDRDKYLVSIHKKGVSIRQLNRLTGTPRGVIERIIRRS